MKDSDEATKFKDVFYCAPFSSVFLFISDFHAPLGKLWNETKLPKTITIKESVIGINSSIKMFSNSEKQSLVSSVSMREISIQIEMI